jgi:site-specific DNA recombinase
MGSSSTARTIGPSAQSPVIQCAIYTRKSTEEGLQQEFNSLDAQREAAEAFIISQKNEGWQVISDHFDDGGYTGGNMDRPAIQRLLAAVESLSAGPARNPLPGSGFQGDEATSRHSA